MISPTRNLDFVGGFSAVPVPYYRVRGHVYYVYYGIVMSNAK